jgi:TonB family protein
LITFVISSFLKHRLMLDDMTGWRSVVLTALVILFLLTGLLASGQVAPDASSNRKIASKVMPIYPHDAMTYNIRGTVKLDAVVTTTGKVRSIEVRGGHPILVKAAVAAVNQWKWEPAATETRQSVDVDFKPDGQQ